LAFNSDFLKLEGAMLYAYVDNHRVEAAPGSRGKCLNCGQEVVAKCGTQRIWHWAHKGKLPCPYEREAETLWHRNWKSKFPSSWCESQYIDANGERHIADVRTTHGLVIEFQHSHLDHSERASRERAYSNLAWVVDGCRLKRDAERFKKGRGGFIKIGKGVYITAHPENAIANEWLNCSSAVFFDFGSDPNQEYQSTNSLWALLPMKIQGFSIFVCVSEQYFINRASRRPDILPMSRLKNEVVNLIEQAKAQIISQQNSRNIEVATQVHWTKFRKTRYRTTYKPKNYYGSRSGGPRL
jgi:competence protein CoiA